MHLNLVSGGEKGAETFKESNELKKWKVGSVEPPQIGEKEQIF